MTPSRFLRFSACALAVSSTALHAQQGCFHSPEAPTGVLMLVGSVGMLCGSTLARKAVARLRKK